MATIKGLITSYDVLENKVDVSPVFQMLKLPDTPLLNQIGISDVTVESKRYEWWDDVLPALRVQLAADYMANDFVLKVVAGEGKKFKVGNVVKVDNTIYRVTTITPGSPNDSLGVEKISSTADEAHTTTDVIEIIGDANVEGAEYGDAIYDQKIERYNVTQIFAEYIKFSGTQLSVSQYINEDVVLDEIQRKLEKMKVLLERSAWLGVRMAPSDNTSPRLMGGIKYFIDADGIKATATWSTTNLDAFLKSIYDKGGVIKEAWMNPSTKAKFNALNQDKLVIQRGDNIAGNLVSTYLSDYGELQLKTTPHLPENMIIVFDSSKVAVKPLRNRQAQYEQLAKTGDYIKGQIIGEYTLEFRNPDLAGIFYVQQ